jgi:hypothetical protein
VAVTCRTPGWRFQLLALVSLFARGPLNTVIVKRQLFWKEVCKFLSGGFFVTMGASWYFAYYRVAVPFFNTTLSPDFLFIRGFIHLGMFLLTFYFGFFRRTNL